MSDSAHCIYWKNSLKLTNTLSLSGYSRAAESTGFYWRELEMAFDAGCQTNNMPSYICLTHLHNDHMAMLNKMLIQNQKNPIIFIPNNDKFQSLLDNTLKYIYLSSKFIHPDSDKAKLDTCKYPYRVVRLNVGESYMFKVSGTGGYYIEGLPSDHGVTSISFGIYESRKRCRAEYSGLTSAEYAKLKSEGVDFSEMYNHYMLCYMSDTNYKPLVANNNYLIFKYPIIVIECTFIYDDDLKKAKKKNHIHWSQIANIVTTTANKYILTHFSRKYMWHDVKKFFDKYNCEVQPLTNIVLWLHTGIVDYSKNSQTNIST